MQQEQPSSQPARMLTFCTWPARLSAKTTRNLRMFHSLHNVSFQFSLRFQEGSSLPDGFCLSAR